MTQSVWASTFAYFFLSIDRTNTQSRKLMMIWHYIYTCVRLVDSVCIIIINSETYRNQHGWIVQDNNHNNNLRVTNGKSSIHSLELQKTDTYGYVGAISKHLHSNKLNVYCTSFPLSKGITLLLYIN